MTPADLIKEFETLADAPEGVTRLRELVLQLAVRGKLVPQNPEDEPASVLLERIAAEKALPKGKGKKSAAKAMPTFSEGNKPYDVPEGWRWAWLGALSHIERGGSPRPIKAYLTDDPEGLNWIKIGDTDKGSKYITSTKQKIRQGGLTKTRMVYPGDFLLTNSMSFGRPYITMIEGCIHDGWLRIQPPTSLNKDYLYVFLSSPFVAGQFKEAAAGAVVMNLNADKVRALPVPLPPLTEQHRIVARADELMGLLDRLEAARDAQDGTRAAARDAVLAALREADNPEEVEVAWGRLAERMDDLLTDPTDVEPLRQTVLQLAVRGRLVPQDSSDEPASVLLERIAAEKARLVKEKKIRKREPATCMDAGDAHFDLPVGWCWARLGSALLDITAGWSPSAQNRPRSGTEWGVLKVSACSWGRFLSDENKALAPGTEPRTGLEVASGDLLISRANTLELVARSVVVENAPPHLMLSDKTLRLTPGSGVCVPYLNLANLSVLTREHYARNASGTSASMRNVSQDAIWQAPIPLPPLSEQHRIVAKVDELMAIINRLAERFTATQETQAAFAAAAVHHLDA